MKGYLTFPEWISPQIIPGFPLLRWYALMYIIIFGFTYFLVTFQIKKNKIKTGDDDTINLFFWCMLGLIFGARLLYIFVYDTTENILQEPIKFLIHIFWPFDKEFHFVGLSGMSYHGGLLGTLVVFFIFCKLNKLNTLKWGDMLATAFPLGYTFGRIGNFINGELYGRITTARWGMIFPQVPEENRYPSDLAWVKETAGNIGLKITDNELVNLPRHPTQLYEAFLEGIFLWIILWFVFRKRKIFKGFQIAVYIIGYGVFRFFIEYFREPDSRMGYFLSFSQGPSNPFSIVWLNFTIGQVFSASMVLLGLIFLILFGAVLKEKSLKT